MIPPIGGLGGLSLANIGGLAQSGETALSGAAGQSALTGQSTGVGQSVGVGQSEPAPGGTAGTGPSGGFSGALSGAISSLESSQRSGDSAAQALATGSVSDPESAVVTVQDAQLEMQLASQIRTKATEAAQSIFQTQV